MSRFRKQPFAPEDLVNLGQPAPDSTPLIIGDWCTLNSGSPSMLVVHAVDDEITVALPDGEEWKGPRHAFRRSPMPG